jgi:DNA-binding beta-propeller fold protein YncE
MERNRSLKRSFAPRLAVGAVAVTGFLAAQPLTGSAADTGKTVHGAVLGSGLPVAKSTVTLWAATSSQPKQLAQTRTGDDGTFWLNLANVQSGDVTLYLTAEGGQPHADSAHRNNPNISLLSVVGRQVPARVVINELTTIGSVWTHAQLFDGKSITGPALSRRIAADNVPNLADVQTGGYGGTTQDALNGAESPTMANFGTLANVLAGCVARVKDDACTQLFAAATPPGGAAPGDTLQAAVAVARNPSHEPGRLFALLDAFYPAPGPKRLRPAPFLPYLSNAPSAWVLPLRFAAGGLNAPGKLMFDSKGNLWTGVNFLVGFQNSDGFWNGGLAKLASNGAPLSPPTGFTGGGVLGPGFGMAIAPDDKVWVDNTSGNSISLFDPNGKPLSPPEGYNLGGQLGKMQGIVVAPDGDVWALDWGKDQVVHLPQGDPAKAEFLCKSPDGKPEHNPCKLKGPFHLAVDQQNRVWITSMLSDTVTRFSAKDPAKVEVFDTGGHSPKGMAIDSQGNAWISNTVEEGLSPGTKAKLLELKIAGKTDEMDRVLVDFGMSHPRGSVSMLTPDGKAAPGSPFKEGGSLRGAWAVAVDGNDHIWVSNFVGGNLVHLCGARTETCPPGMKTGDAISPPGGYVGGGMQNLTDVAVDPAGNVWVANNWKDPDSCFGKAPEGKSTLCGGTGVTVFYGMAKPVRAPQIGPAQPMQ